MYLRLDNAQHNFFIKDGNWKEFGKTGGGLIEVLSYISVCMEALRKATENKSY